MDRKLQIHTVYRHIKQFTVHAARCDEHENDMK